MYIVKKRHKKIKMTLWAVVFICFLYACQTGKVESDYIPVKEQGSFAVGGIVKTESGEFDPIEDGAFNPGNQSSEGQTLHGDHAFVQYQKPADARELALVYWHGFDKSIETWQTTPNSLKGQQSII